MNPLQQQIEAFLPEKKNKITDSASVEEEATEYGFNEALSLCKQSLPKIIELIEKDTREAIKRSAEHEKLNTEMGLNDSLVHSRLLGYNDGIDRVLELLDNLINKE